MKVTVEDLSSVKKKIVVEFPPEDIEKEMAAVYRDIGTKVSIAGFRKGKVPKGILESRYKDYVLSEAASNLIENSYPKIVREKSLSPVSRPAIDAREEIREGEPFSYAATVEVRPSIKVEGYVGMEIKKEDVVVSEDDVEKTMEILRERNAHFNEVDKSAMENDLAVVDFEGFLDGKPVANTKASDYPLVIGTNVLVPDLENSLKGMKKGEEKEVKVTFPEDYRQKELSGKELVFNVKVKSVKEKILPALDDEFAKDLKLDSIAQLKDKIREGMQHDKEDGERERLKREILDRLIEKNSFDLPPSLVAAYLQTFVSQAMENIKRGRVKPEDAIDMTPEKLKEKYENVAERRARGEIILDAIAAQEGITVGEEELNDRIKELAASRYQRFEEFKKQLVEQGSDAVLKAGMLEEKVFDFIMEKANR